ncbi:hypothetical protein BUALT_Bualt13G0058000 [Buddleja alternifolia]|uniref:Uncharacterized protein n=1 Tax=Buddleja alternifolia TaxID=168488 RepID=A0AAV6WU70_9LAMI|nr:hypothetical protein BUALT_Bualt13G0058000 [Buddleja alternifolia]
MAICGGLEHIFEKPLPETPTFLESLSPWKQIKDSSFMEIFGELHFKENDQSSTAFSPSSSLSSSSTFTPGVNPFPSRGKDVIPHIYQEKKQHRHSDSFSSMNSESLSMCTEGLGFESCDDVDDLLSDNAFDIREEKTKSFTRNDSKRSRTSIHEFPPPISCIEMGDKCS